MTSNDSDDDDDEFNPPPHVAQVDSIGEKQLTLIDKVIYIYDKFSVDECR